MHREAPSSPFPPCNALQPLPQGRVCGGSAPFSASCPLGKCHRCLPAHQPAWVFSLAAVPKRPGGAQPPPGGIVPQRRASGLAGVAAAVCLPAFLFRGGRLRGPFHRRASQAGCAPCAGPLPGQFVAPAKLCTPAPEVPSLSPCPPAATASPQAGTVASNRTSSNRGSWNLLALQVWREWGPAPRPAVAFPAAARTPPAGGVVPRPARPPRGEGPRGSALGRLLPRPALWAPAGSQGGGWQAGRVRGGRGLVGGGFTRRGTSTGQRLLRVLTASHPPAFASVFVILTTRVSWK